MADAVSREKPPRITAVASRPLAAVELTSGFETLSSQPHLPDHGGREHRSPTVPGDTSVLVHGSKLAGRGASETDSHRKSAGTAEFGE